MPPSTPNLLTSLLLFLLSLSTSYAVHLLLPSDGEAALFFYYYVETCSRDCSLTRTNGVLHANHISMP